MNMDPFDQNQGDLGGIPEEPKGLIERLEKKLYSRKGSIFQKGRTQLHPKKFSVSSEWEDDTPLTYKGKPPPPPHSVYTKIFIVSLLFFAVAAAVAGYNLYSNRTVLSPENVILSISGPVSVKGGDTLSIQVSIENKNPVGLAGVVVGANFPPGTRYPANPEKDFPRYRKTVGKMASGETRSETISAVLLGADGEKKDIQVYLEFQIAGSRAGYSKKKTFSLFLSKAPITLTADLLKEITSGQNLTLGVNIESGSQADLYNPLVKIEYPVGFLFKKSTPAPVSGNNVWNVGKMQLGDARHIIIEGTLQGDNAQEKVFRIFSGTTAKQNSTNIDTSFAALLANTMITRPFLAVNLLINSSMDPNYILYNQRTLSVEVRTLNSLPNRIINGEITLSFSGDAVNKNRIEPLAGGYYNDANSTLFWDERTTGSLSSISAGSVGSVGFGMGLLPFVRPDNTTIKNPTIHFGISIKGKRVSEENVPEEINSFVTRVVKIGTVTDFTATTYHQSGPFQNTGPMPPRVGKETTYTVVWKILNTSNDILGAKVTTSLPPYVRWTDQIFPTDSNINYNPVTSQVTWNIGDIKAGAGYEFEAPEVSFQVGITPSINHVGEEPRLTYQSVFTGTDDFTGVEIKTALEAETTRLLEDPNASFRDFFVGL